MKEYIQFHDLPLVKEVEEGNDNFEYKDQTFLQYQRKKGRSDLWDIVFHNYKREIYKILIIASIYQGISIIIPLFLSNMLQVVQLKNTQ